MKVEVYRLNRFNGGTNTKAFVDLIIENELIVKGFSLVEGKEGLFLGNPREKGKDGKYFDNVRFNTLEFKKEVEKMVIEKYNSKEEIKNESVTR